MLAHDHHAVIVKENSVGYDPCAVGSNFECNERQGEKDQAELPDLQTARVETLLLHDPLRL
jgi:hypothetical protein